MIFVKPLWFWYFYCYHIGKHGRKQTSGDQRANMKISNKIGVLFAVVCSVLSAVQAFAQSVSLSDIDTSLQVYVDKSKIITVADGIQDVTIANPRIADFSVVSDTSLYLIGKSPGLTTLTFLSDSGALVKTIDINVQTDVRELSARLREVLPKDTLRVMPANTGVIVSGTVSSAQKMNLAMEISEQFFPGDVSNAITVRAKTQPVSKIVKLNFNLSVIKLSDSQIARLKSKNQLFEEQVANSNRSQTLGQFTLFMDERQQKRLIANHRIPTIDPKSVTINSAKAQTAFFGQVFDAPILSSRSEIIISKLRSGLFVSSKINSQSENIIELQLNVETATPQAVSASSLGFPTYLIERQAVSHKMALDKARVTLVEIGGSTEKLQRVHNLFDFYVNTLVLPKAQRTENMRYFLVFTSENGK